MKVNRKLIKGTFFWEYLKIGHLQLDSWQPKTGRFENGSSAMTMRSRRLLKKNPAHYTISTTIKPIFCIKTIFNAYNCRIFRVHCAYLFREIYTETIPLRLPLSPVADLDDNPAYFCCKIVHLSLCIIRELKQGRRQRQQRRPKTMIWLVEWGQIIVLHVRYALKYISLT